MIDITLVGWILPIFTVIGIILNIKKMKLCFVVFFITNIAWILYNIASKTYEQIPLWFAYNIFNIYGFIQWRKQERRDLDGQRLPNET